MAEQQRVEAQRQPHRGHEPFRSGDQARELGKQGGLKSGEVRRLKASIRDLAEQGFTTNLGRMMEESDRLCLKLVESLKRKRVLGAMEEARYWWLVPAIVKACDKVLPAAIDHQVTVHHVPTISAELLADLRAERMKGLTVTPPAPELPEPDPPVE